jgi:hypothetical protein
VIYNKLRENYQVKIDKAFDTVSKQIGFVVVTSLPVVFDIGEKGMVKELSMGAENLKGTLFEKELFDAMGALKDDPFPFPSPGTYKLQVLWYDALKVKLRTHWCEPAQFDWRWRERDFWREKVVTGVREPVHWFDPGYQFEAEESVLIAVIDEVYPELQIANTIAAQRQAIRKDVFPDVREPVQEVAHGATRIRPDLEMNVLSELANVLRKFGY